MSLTFGFVGLEHLMNQRVSSENIEVVRDAITKTLEEHQRQVGEMVSTLAAQTVEYSANFRQGFGGTMQPLDDQGNPLPVKGGSSYTVAFPIKGAGTAWGTNRVSRAFMTVEEANENTYSALKQDADWLKRHMLGALLDNTSYVFPDPDKGNLTVQPLANGDTAKFTRNNGTEAVDNHYSAQAAAIGDATNPFPAIYTELTEHPENDGATIVAYVASNLIDDIEALGTFVEVPDPDVVAGNSASVLSGSIERGFGDEVLGKAGKVWVVEWSTLPDDYILGVAVGATPALKMREYDVPALQGLIEENNSPDGNLEEYRLIRYAGFGAYNRVGACVVQVEAGDTTYDIPSGYATPMKN